MATNSVNGNTLVVEQMFHKFYMCRACSTECYFCVTNSWDMLPRPTRCPYQSDEEIKPDWQEMPQSEKEDEDSSGKQ